MWNLFKVNNKDTWRRYGVFIAKFEQISHMALMFSLLTLNKIQNEIQLKHSNWEKTPEERSETRKNGLQCLRRHDQWKLGHLWKTEVIQTTWKNHWSLNFWDHTSVCTMKFLCLLIWQTVPNMSTRLSCSIWRKQPSIAINVPVRPTPALCKREFDVYSINNLYSFSLGSIFRVTGKNTCYIYHGRIIFLNGFHYEPILQK